MTDLPAGQRQHVHRDLWQTKSVLREVYEHLYRKIVAACRPGLTLEVGGGSGNLKDFLPNALSFDIVSAPWLDFVADAQSLPVRSKSVANVVMFDVLHHIQYPIRFLREAERILGPGGRLIMLEPGITLLSGPFYRFFHQEPVVSSVDPLEDGEPDPTKDPFVGNQAIPTLLFTRDLQRLARLFPNFRVTRMEWLSLFAYPLSGGFKAWSLVSPKMARMLLRLEDQIAPRIGRFCAFRLMTILEKAR